MNTIRLSSFCEYVVKLLTWVLYNWVDGLAAKKLLLENGFYIVVKKLHVDLTENLKSKLIPQPEN